MVLTLRINDSLHGPNRGLLVCVALFLVTIRQLELLAAPEGVRATEIREMSETRVAVQVLLVSTRQDLDVTHVKERPIFSQVSGAISNISLD